MATMFPQWLEMVATVLFVAIAVTHLGYLLLTDGQRRAWHSCHVLIAVGMGFMYAPSVIDPLAIPAGFWRLVFAISGVIAAAWALGGVGRAPQLLWLLTAVDLGVMLFMWSPGAAQSPLVWPVAAYLLGQAGMWALDAYRRLDGGTPLLCWSELPVGGEALSSHASAGDGAGLIGELDMGASMIVMAVGMAYMLVAMRLAM